MSDSDRKQATLDYGEKIFGIEYNGEQATVQAAPNTFFMEIVYEVQRRSSHALLPHPPPIFFEKPKPLKIKPDNVWPTDILGCYISGGYKNTGSHLNPCEGRRIEIYPERIALCRTDLARQALGGVLAWQQCDLEVVVIVHELMHALLHTGCQVKQGDVALQSDALKVLQFLKKRLSDWHRIRGPKAPSPVLELHAQLGTWHILNRNGSKPSGGPALAFLDLMKHQPKEYVVASDLLLTPPKALWAWMCCAHYGDEKDAFGDKDKLETYLREGLNNGVYPDTQGSLYTKLF